MEASAVPGGEVRSRSGAMAMLREAVLRDLPLVLLVGAYIATALSLNATLGVPREVGISLRSWRLLTAWTAFYAAAGFLAALSYGLIRHRRSLMAASSWKHALATFFHPKLLLSFAVVYVLLPPFMSTFIGFKMTIPLANPYSWDAQIMAWDRFLAFGRHPWEMLQPLFGHPLATRVLDRVYYTWFPFIWLTLLWQMWHGDHFSESRSQFLLTFALCWILLGTVAATLLSSAGPVFYGHFVSGSDPYAPLMDHLHAIDAHTPLTAVWAQGVLWESYVDPTTTAVEGISAMPSMHVAMATLMTLIAFRVNRKLGWVYAAYATLIFLGSIYLGWHYALDGVVGALGTVAIWRGAGRITEWWEQRRTRQPQAA